MARITGFYLDLTTGKKSGADSDGDVYLSLCGREFYVESKNEDLLTGDTHRYAFGDAPDPTHPTKDYNEPRDQMLVTENLNKFPVYIRFVPRSREDNWQLQRADVYLIGSANAPHPDFTTTAYIMDDELTGIWLGIHSGLVAYLLPYTRTQGVKRPRRPARSPKRRSRR